MNCCGHEIACRNCADLLLLLRCADKSAVFTNLYCRELVFQPPVSPITKRCSQGPTTKPVVTPPRFTIGEFHLIVAGHCFSAGLESADLIRESFWSAPVVVVPMRDDFATRLRTAKVALLANAEAFLNDDKADGRISRDEVKNVLAVRENQQFAIRIRLCLKRQDRLREPLASVPCQAQRCDERDGPRSLREPPGR